MPHRPGFVLIVRICLLINAVTFACVLLIGARTGHLATGALVWVASSTVTGLIYLRSRS